MEILCYTLIGAAFVIGHLLGYCGGYYASKNKYTGDK